MGKDLLTSEYLQVFNEKEKTKGCLHPITRYNDITGAHKSVRAITNNLNPKSRKGKDNMRFTTNAKQLSETLVNMNRVINTKNVLPILADIVFTVKDDNLTLKASDSEVTMQTAIALTDCEGEGSFAVNGMDIVEAVRNLPDNPLTFSMENEEGKVVKIDYFSGMFTLPVDSIMDYPTQPEMTEEDTKGFIISEGLLQENIARTLFATADDELRPVMNGIYFDLTTELLAVVASDGHSLVRNRIMSIKAEDDSKAGSFILPKKPAAILKNILNRGEEKEMTVSFDGRQAVIATENFTMQCRLIEGRYPNYNAVIPQNNQNIVMVDRNTLVNALKRVTPFSNSSSQLVRIHVENNKLTLDTEDHDFSKTASEHMSCDYNGTAMSIGMKGPKTIEILGNMASAEIQIELADPSRAALIKPSEQPDDMEILMLQMPMLLID